MLALLVAVAVSLVAGCGPLDPQSQVNAGAEALARGGTTNLVRAVYLLEQAARDLPGDARCQNLYGMALYDFGKPKEAAEAFQKAVACDRNNPAFRYNLGLAAYAQRDLATALEQFQSCTALDPRNVPAWLFLGATYLNLNKLDEAFRATRNAYDMDKNSAEALSNLAVISCRRGRPRDAETWLNEALRVAPNNPQVALNMARLYELELKDKRRALEFYRRYSALAPDSQLRFTVLRSTRQLELDLNLPPSPLPAATNAQPVVAAAPIIVNTSTPTPTVTMTSELQPAALDALIAQLKAAGRNRDAAEVSLSLADHYQQQHDTHSASAAYAQAVELDPLNSLTHFRLGELFLQQGQKAPALQSFQEAVRLKPDFVAALRRAAPLAAEIGLPAVAVAAYKRIVELDPNDARALFHLGDLQDRYLKNRTVADQTYQTFLKRFPTAPDAATVRSRLSRSSAASREIAKPVVKPSPKLITRTEEPAPMKLPLPTAHPAPPPAPPPDRRTPQERYQDAFLLLQRGAYAEAGPQFEALLRVDPNFAKAHLALGQIYSQRAETKTKARQHYIQFLQLRPDDPKAPEVRRWLNETRWMP
ncbi:MAG: tetratricopeptide repeat protein [Verrucomicrobia bacterium]|nr:tetratricopeptide repeat protein [Verrucomicrobiota bacterium]